MIGYHFAFDLRYFGVIRTDFEHDPFWLACARAILSSFLLLAGVSLVLADRARRAAGALLAARRDDCRLRAAGERRQLRALSEDVHLVRRAARDRDLADRWRVRSCGGPALAAAIGVAVIVAGTAFAHPAFDNARARLDRLHDRQANTEDYVPLFPWTGVVFVGIALGHCLARRDFAPIAAA